MVGLEIARQLALDDAPTWRAGSRWQNSYVHSLLGKEVYKGTWWYGKARWVATEGWDRVIQATGGYVDWGAIPAPGGRTDVGQGASPSRSSGPPCPGGTPKSFSCLQHLVRCSECGLLFGCRSKTRVTGKYKDRTVHLRPEDSQSALPLLRNADGSTCGAGQGRTSGPTGWRSWSGERSRPWCRIPT